MASRHGVSGWALGLVVAACTGPPGNAPIEYGSLQGALSNVPGLTAPFDFAKIPSTVPTLSASVSSGTSGSVDTEFDWGTDPTFASFSTATVSGTPSGGTASYTLSGGQALASGTTYYWRARSSDAGTGVWSGFAATRSFTVDTALGANAWFETTKWQFDDVPPANQVNVKVPAAGDVELGYQTAPVFSEDFEDGTLNKWLAPQNVTAPDAIANTVVNDGEPSPTHVLKYQNYRPPNSDPAIFNNNMALQTRGRVDWWGRSDFSNFGLHLYTSAAGGNDAVTVGFQGGFLRYFGGGFNNDFIPAVAVSLNTWHRVRVEYDTVARTFDTWFDGAPVATGTAFNHSGDVLNVYAFVMASLSNGDAIADAEMDDINVWGQTMSASYYGPAIAASDLANSWGSLAFSRALPVGTGTCKVQVQWWNGSTWALVPNVDLAGNSAGFTASPVSLTNLSAATYPTLRLVLTLARAAAADASPQLLDWGVYRGIVVSPQNPTVPPRGTQTFTATGGSGALTWTLPTNASGGSIGAATGLYTAGATCNVTDVVRVTDALGNTRTTNVTVGPCVSIAPPAPSTPPRGAIAFTASGGSGTGFAWSLSTNASGGSINSISGAYVAGSTCGVTDVVRVVDSLGNLANASVTVGACVAIAPASASVPPRGSQSFSASGGSGTGWLWSLSANPSGGSINPATGAYVAGPVGSVTDVVQVADSLGNLRTANVTVGAGITITPAAPGVAPRGAVAFSASGGSGTGWSWALVGNASGGSINAVTGAYLAGAVCNVTDTVSVTDSLGNTRTATVTVGACVTISPPAPGAPPRGAVAFSASGGSGSGYTWAFTSNLSGGSIGAGTGAYTAGATGSVTDVIHVTDSLGNVASANVAVGPGVSILPASAALPPRGSQSFSASGGSGTGFVWTLSTNASGGSIGAATGVYSAGPTGSVVDVVTVTDSLGNTRTANVTVGPVVSISPPSASVVPRGSQTFTASGGSGTGFTWSLSTNASGGGITAGGTYTAGATGSVTDVVQVVDSLGNVRTASVTVGPGVSTLPASAAVPPRGSQAFSASGGSGAGFVFSLLASPSGGSITAGGAYTAGSIGSVTDVVRVVDSLGNVKTASVTVGPAISISPPSASVPVSGPQAFSASGGSGTGFVWSLSVNASGASLNAGSGAYVAGTTGNVTDVVQVTDSLGNVQSASVSVGSSLVITPGSASVAPKGAQAFAASGGSGTGYGWTLLANPSGGSINPSTGAYLAGPVCNVVDVVKLTDSLANTKTANVNVGACVSVSPPAPSLPPRGGQTFTASGGSGSGFTWSLAPNASGGSITAGGSYTAGATGGVVDGVVATDSLGNTGSTTVTVGPGVAIAPASAAVAPRATQAFSASGGSGTGFVWSLSTNASGGNISAGGFYTAGSTGSVTDVVQAVDSLGNVKTANVVVGPAVTITPGSASVPPNGGQAFVASGGSGTGYAWSLATNASGGSVNPATGAYLAGPTGSVVDVVQVTDSLGNARTANVTVGAGVTITPASASVPPRGGQSFAASGGSGSGFVWSFVANPSGGSLNAGTGAYLAGATPNVTDVLQVVDSLGNRRTANVAVGAGVAITPASGNVPPRGSQLFTASGGSGIGFTWSFQTNGSGGSIGAGSGAYSAGAAGSSTDVVLVQDSLGNTRTATITVGPGVSIAPAGASLPPLGSQTFTASGGSGSGYAWALTTNASGGSINPSTGAYVAGPIGAVSDTVQVSDSLGNVRSVAVTVGPGVAILPPSAATPPRGALAFTASGGSGAGFVWSMQSAPSGGTVTPATGAYLAGSTGSVTDVVRVSDSLGNGRTVNVTVGPGVSLSPGTPAVPPRGSQTFTAAGGSGTGYVYSLSVNASGGTVNAATGDYVAGPTGSVTDTVHVQDSLGNVATMAVTVGPAVSITPPAANLPPLGALVFSASGGSGLGYLWSMAANGSGGSIDPSTGAYAAGATGNSTDVVEVRDSLGNLANSTVVVGSPLAIAPVNPTVAVGQAQAFTVSGGQGPYLFTLAAAPSGGSISPAGAYLAGTIANVVDIVKVQDTLGATATTNVSVTPGALDHVVVSPPVASGTAGTPISGAVDLVDAFGNSVGAGARVTLTAGGAAVFCATSLGAPGALNQPTLDGDTDAGGHGNFQLCDTKAEVVAVTAVFPGQTVAATPASFGWVPGAPDHARVRASGPAALDACGTANLDLAVVDAFDNVVASPLSVDLCGEAAKSAQIVATTLGNPVRSGVCVSGALDAAGTARAQATDAQAETVTFTATGAGLTGPASRQDVTWKVGPVSPAHTLFAFDQGASPQSLTTNSGRLTARVRPRDACDLAVTTLAPSDFALAADAPLAVGALVPDATAASFAADVSLPMCPANPTLLLGVTARVQGAAVVDSGGAPVKLEVQPVCVQVDPDRSTASLVGASTAAACYSFSRANPSGVPPSLGPVRVRILVSPVDTNGNAMGPGQSVSVLPDPPRLLADAALDNGDGTYFVDVGSDACDPGTRHATVQVDGVTLTTGFDLTFTCAPVDPARSTVTTEPPSGSVGLGSPILVDVAARDVCDLAAFARGLKLAVDPAALAGASGPQALDASGKAQLTLAGKTAGKGEALVSADGVALAPAPIEWTSAGDLADVAMRAEAPVARAGQPVVFVLDVTPKVAATVPDAEVVLSLDGLMLVATSWTRNGTSASLDQGLPRAGPLDPAPGPRVTMTFHATLAPGVARGTARAHLVAHPGGAPISAEAAAVVSSAQTGGAGGCACGSAPGAFALAFLFLARRRCSRPPIG